MFVPKLPTCYNNDNIVTIPEIDLYKFCFEALVLEKVFAKSLTTFLKKSLLQSLDEN